MNNLTNLQSYGKHATKSVLRINRKIVTVKKKCNQCQLIFKTKANFKAKVPENKDDDFDMETYQYCDKENAQSYKNCLSCSYDILEYFIARNDRHLTNSYCVEGCYVCFYVNGEEWFRYEKENIHGNVVLIAELPFVMFVVVLLIPRR